MGGWGEGAGERGGGGGGGWREVGGLWERRLAGYVGEMDDSMLAGKTSFTDTRLTQRDESHDEHSADCVPKRVRAPPSHRVDAVTVRYSAIRLRASASAFDRRLESRLLAFSPTSSALVSRGAWRSRRIHATADFDS